MKVELADKAGFCFGVNRAVDLVYQEVKARRGRVYTYGPIIHNEEVIRDLEEKGVVVTEDYTDIKGTKDDAIILRSHGVPRAVMESLAFTGMRIIDAACPFVKKIHHIVEEQTRSGKLIIIVGNPKHPEVEGIAGWGEPDQIMIIETEEEASALNLPMDKKLCIVSQTTFNVIKFSKIVEILQKKGYDIEDIVGKDYGIEIHNTICSATRERQEAAKQLAERVDAMIVIGGLSSSNTRKLYEICSEKCLNTYFIQTVEDLEGSDFSRFDYVGITAGASTPNNIIEEVQKYVRVKF